MATKTINQSVSQPRLTGLLTLATVFVGTLHLLMRKVTNAMFTSNEEKKFMSAAPAKAPSKAVLKQSKDVDSLPEILEIVRISQEVQASSPAFEEKNRRVVNSREFCDEVSVMRYNK